jgi:hypothetical protein
MVPGDSARAFRESSDSVEKMRTKRTACWLYLDLFACF